MTDDATDPITHMLARRSCERFEEPGPTHEQIRLILEAATTVPDHGALRPWRFVVVSGDEREAFGEALLDAAVSADPDLPQVKRFKARARAFVAPTLIVIIFSPRDGHIRQWEQEASAASTGYAMVLAAHMIGVGAIWKTIGARNGPLLADLLDMGPEERLMGWINLGTAVGEPRERRNPVTASDVTTVLHGGQTVPWA